MSSFLVGFHAEGWDHLILQAFLAKLLDIAEEEIEPDVIDRDNRGWAAVQEIASKALKRFYGKCAHCAVLSVDNDGNVDLTGSDRAEDPRHPRHANHIGQLSEDCRHCQLDQIVSRTRAELNWISTKPGIVWPVVVAVPVETVEAWILTARAIFDGSDASSFHAEQLPRSVLKQRLYGRPFITREDVERVALPLVRACSPENVETLCAYSQSFRFFYSQVKLHRENILTDPGCWPGT